MKAKFISVVCIICTIYIYGCSGSGKHSDVKYKLSFFDSVSGKMDLGINQIRRHTLIYSGYITPKSKFSGDIIYYPYSANPLVIIYCSDGLVCSYRFLLVYSQHTKKNTDLLLAETDCDEDYSTNYSSLSFKIFNKTKFYTREVQYIRDQGQKTKVVVTDKFYQVNKNGKIDLLKQKPAGLIVPVYVQPENIDDTADDSLNKKP